MILILMGPPGCGKGTQAKKIEEKYSLLQLSTGDMLRAAIRNGTEVGLIAKDYIDRGALVPDDVIVGVMRDRMAMEDCRNGFLLDGFPRTVPQAESLEKLLEESSRGISAVINIDASDAEVIKRLSGRRQCGSCGATYHLIFSPSKQGDKCDKCGKELLQRGDDKEETVKERLTVYRKQTSPLIEFYKKRGLLRNVLGTGTIEGVFRSVCSLIDKEKDVGKV